MIGTGGERERERERERQTDRQTDRQREPRKSVLSVRLDNDDIFIYIYI